MSDFLAIYCHLSGFNGVIGDLFNNSGGKAQYYRSCTTPPIMIFVLNYSFFFKPIATN